MAPLNQALYDRLLAFQRRQAGDGAGITIDNAGLAAQGRAVSVVGRVQWQAIETGERYALDCPFCNDRRGRLSVAHVWGVVEPQTGDSRWWAAYCFNENCLSKANNRRQLRKWIYEGAGFSDRTNIVIASGCIEEPPTEVGYPGFCVPLEALPPEHGALQYLRQRGFDPYAISHYYGVRFCMQAPSDNPMAAGRLIIPIVSGGKMVAWQGRYVGDIDFKKADIPKYVNCRGTKKSHWLYCSDAARSSPYVVVVEGIADVWRVGWPAVAAFGKHLSLWQIEFINQHWPTAVVAYDSDACADITRECNSLSGPEIMRCTSHPSIAAKIRPSTLAIGTVLPAGQDPGSMDPQEFWWLVEQSARGYGIILRDTRPRLHLPSLYPVP